MNKVLRLMTITLDFQMWELKECNQIFGESIQTKLAQFDRLNIPKYLHVNTLG